MKVSNISSPKGKKVANQFLIEDCFVDLSKNGDCASLRGDMFQSYDSNIVFIATNQGDDTFTHQVYLDKTYWDYSTTTGKYRNQFLGETKAETQKKIDSGEYKLVDLN